MTTIIPNQAPSHAKKFFSTLCEEHGFRITLAAFAPEAFGNIHIVAECDCFAIDYRIDRGDESLALIVNQREYLLEDVSRLIDEQPVHDKMANQEHWLLDHVGALKDRFRDNLNDEAIAILEKSRIERLHRMFPGSVRTFPEC